jgi:hypothetical protein
MVLVLSASGPNHWTVTAEPEASIERILLISYHRTTATGPTGVPVESYAGEEGSPLWAIGCGLCCSPPCPDIVGEECCATELVDVAEQLAGRKLTAFAGCYAGSEVTVATCSCEPPACTAPDDLLLECDTAGGVPDASVQTWLGEVVTTGDCGELSVIHDAPEVFESSCAGAPVAIPVTFVVTDEEGNQATCSSTVTVLDRAPPEVEVEPRSTCLWPPDHEMVEVAGVTARDACDPSPGLAARLTSDERTATELGAGGAAHCPDAAFGGGALRLRAERSGTSDADNGRVYGAVSVVATDSCGNTAEAALAPGAVQGCPGVACVPHDHSEGEPCLAVDDGQLDATLCH